MHNIYADFVKNIEIRKHPSSNFLNSEGNTHRHNIIRY